MYKNIVYTAKSLIRYVAHKLDFCIAAYAQIVGSAKRHISRLYAVVKGLSKLRLWLVASRKKTVSWHIPSPVAVTRQKRAMFWTTSLFFSMYWFFCIIRSNQPSCQAWISISIPRIFPAVAGSLPFKPRLITTLISHEDASFGLNALRLSGS